MQSSEQLIKCRWGELPVTVKIKGKEVTPSKPVKTNGHRWDFHEWHETLGCRGIRVFQGGKALTPAGSDGSTLNYSI